MKKTVIISLAVVVGALILSGICWNFCYKKRATPTSPAIERTCALIKPDAVQAHHAGEIIAMIEKNGFSIIALNKIKLDLDDAQKFYNVHLGKPFFNELVKYMSSGPIIAMVLEKPDAVNAWRKLMGSTNPQQAEQGTIRQLFGTDVQQNAVHGSDSLQNAAIEIAFFFPELID